MHRAPSGSVASSSAETQVSSLPSCRCPPVPPGGAWCLISRRGVGRGGPGYRFCLSPCRALCGFQANSFTLRGMRFSCQRNSTDESTCSGAEHVSYIFPQQPPHGPRIARLAKCAFALVLRECRIAGRGDLFAPPLIYGTPAPGYRMFICCLG
jgi:hypothetical protein